MLPGPELPGNRQRWYDVAPGASAGHQEAGAGGGGPGAGVVLLASLAHGFFARASRRAYDCLPNTAARSKMGTTSCIATYPDLLAIPIWVSTSASDACARETCCKYSRVEGRLWPSAMLDGIETAARQIWLVKPYNPALGNAGDDWYSASTKSMPPCQTRSCRK